MVSRRYSPCVKPEVLDWLDENGIWDWDLVGEDDGDHGPLYRFYFSKEADAIMFTLRWS